jgi:hypothetical protein
MPRLEDFSKVRTDAFAWMIVLVWLGGCAGIPTPEQRLETAFELTQAHDWRIQVIEAGAFDLASAMPRQKAHGDTLTVYIEGDGFGWVSADTPSNDPTPIDPIALKLALQHPDGHAAYLARPCQYLIKSVAPCNRRYWMGARFAPEVIDAQDRAVDTLKRRTGAKNITLVGYSGGGAVAALLAARRHDVVRLVTIAGTLDTAAWVNLHKVDPLDRSLNPLDFRLALLALPQIHYVGGLDRVMPRGIADGFVNGIDWRVKPQVIEVIGFDHHCCWTRDWAAWVQGWTQP